MRKPTEEVLFRAGAIAPSGRLLRAAVSGLLAASAAACGDDDSGNDQGQKQDNELSDSELTAMCKDKIDDAVDKAIEKQDLDKACADMVKAAQDDYQPSDSQLTALCADMVGAADDECMSDLDKANQDVADGKDQLAMLTEDCKPLLGTAEEKTIKSEQKEYTFAELTDMCDDRGGYTQVGAGCGGHNTCKGFIYNDWGPGAATLTENSCAGSNACLGLYCVDTAKDQKRKPKDLYAMDFGDPGPHACVHCHALGLGDDKYDETKFLVWHFAPDNNPYSGPERTIDNWKDTRTAAQQERIVAFGSHGVLPDGTAYEAMAPYYKVMSRKEIAALVKYVREELTPVFDDTTLYKTKDPS